MTACPSVDRLLETAVKHKMLGHLHRLVTAPEAAEPGALTAPGDSRESGADLFDPLLVARIRELQRASAARNLAQAGQLLRLLELLRQAGVEAIPYKGPALAERLYGDVTMRWSADLDLIVRHEQALLARQVLLASGLQDGSPFNARVIEENRSPWVTVPLLAVSRRAVHRSSLGDRRGAWPPSDGRRVAFCPIAA